MRYDFKTTRLHVTDGLDAGATVMPAREQAHYLVNVLRLKHGAPVLLFNGRDGEWLAHVEDLSRRTVTLRVGARTRAQAAPCDLHYLFAPLKRARLDYMAQKAVELGASMLRPVITARTMAERVNLARLEANAVEAAEQCGVLTVAQVCAPLPLSEALAEWRPERRLVFCDERAPIADPVATLAPLGPGPLAVLIGPEGGFDEAEQAMLRDHPCVTAISLGPRIMRADTAAVAALTLVQAVLGDWRRPPE